MVTIPADYAPAQLRQGLSRLRALIATYRVAGGERTRSADDLERVADEIEAETVRREARG